MSDSLTRRERRIMALWDAGKSIQQIAAKMELPIGIVRSKITAFHIGREYPDAVRNITLGSMTLAAAVRAARANSQRTGI